MHLMQKYNNIAAYTYVSHIQCTYIDIKLNMHCIPQILFTKIFAFQNNLNNTLF